MEIFFCEDPDNISGFGGHRVSAVATQLCFYKMRATLDTMYRNGSGQVPTQLSKSECHARIGFSFVNCRGEK